MTAKKCTKSLILVQIWCFATVNLLLFGLSSCRRRPLGSLLKSLSNDDGDGKLECHKRLLYVYSSHFWYISCRHCTTTQFTVYLEETSLFREFYRGRYHKTTIFSVFSYEVGAGAVLSLRMQLQQIFPRFETSMWNNSDQVWNSASSIF